MQRYVSIFVTLKNYPNMLKLFITPLLLVLLTIGCGQSNSYVYKEEVLAVADTKAEMRIDGMSCQAGCAAYIDEELH